MAEETGEVTNELIKRYSKLAKGDIGLIIPGYLFVHPIGRAMKYQVGIHGDEMIAGLKKLVEAVHQNSGKIALQLAHGGRYLRISLNQCRVLGKKKRFDINRVELYYYLICCYLLLV